MTLARKIAGFTSSFLDAPLHALSGVATRCLYRVRLPARVGLLRAGARERPLILQLETVNVCNAACIFCSYPTMKRPKGVMELALFEKIAADYAAFGGGALSFTPVVGDALLDPHLLRRLELLEALPAIDQITLTTNGIALERYSDSQVRYLLERLFCIQVSIGGLDRESYGAQYGVDRFRETHEAMERLIRLSRELERPARLTFAFRTDDWRFTRRFRKELSGYRRRGVFVSHIWSYDNYAGVVTKDVHPELSIRETPAQKRLACAYPSVHMAVCWDGRVTACGCVDFECDKLRIGDARDSSLAEIWRGPRHTGILDSFPRGALAPVCRDCSAYTPDTLFAQPFFKKVRPLTLGFFQQFWGG